MLNMTYDAATAGLCSRPAAADAASEATGGFASSSSSCLSGVGRTGASVAAPSVCCAAAAARCPVALPAVAAPLPPPRARVLSFGGIDFHLQVGGAAKEVDCDSHAKLVVPVSWVGDALKHPWMRGA